LLTFLTGAFPSVVFYRYLYLAADAAGVTQVTAVMPTTLRVYNLIGEITIGLAAGMLAAGSWSFAARRLRRLLYFGLWAAGLALVQQVIMTPIMIIKPSLIMQL
jgi:hypothetical protein